jgi:DNA/RNA-binding domain of Phe-tRNA-synthetase-like protein
LQFTAQFLYNTLMKFKINEKIFEQFPGLNVGVIVAREIDNTGESPEISNLLQEQSEVVRANFDLDSLADDPKIDAWRKAYSAFRAKPKKYKCSVENLYRMVLEGIKLRSINKVVDIYNYISLKHTIPVGGDDINGVDGDIELKFAQGTESFTQLNSDRVDDPKEGEVIYVDDKDVLCRRWNWRECDKSKMTKGTKNVTLVVEGLPPITKDEMSSILSELGDLVKIFCGGTIEQHILNSQDKEITV